MAAKVQLRDQPMVGRPARCPMCKSDTVQRWRPFCSRRCADLDLARWLKGGYAVPVVSADDDEDGDDPALMMPLSDDK